MNKKTRRETGNGSLSIIVVLDCCCQGKWYFLGNHFWRNCWGNRFCGYWLFWTIIFISLFWESISRFFAYFFVKSLFWEMLSQKVDLNKKKEQKYGKCFPKKMRWKWLFRIINSHKSDCLNAFFRNDCPRNIISPDNNNSKQQLYLNYHFRSPAWYIEQV